MKVAGRNVDPGQRKTIFFAGRGKPRSRDRQQIIVALGVEQGVFGQRAGGDEPHHVAPHDGLGTALARLGRVFGLFADGDAVAQGNQPVQIFVGTHDRHAAHRNVAALVPAALGEHDAECARGGLGVVEEHLVEIAHPVEQQAVRIIGLDLDVLLEHGTRARIDVAGRRWAVRWNLGFGQADGVRQRHWLRC